ncbi:hypothetical protein vBBak6_061 [Bacillus phage v_B-Bak6]|uniref:Uncharacterized protein n=1 Tax=Bacillus phage Basilisk TaxID=1296654 RepID=S5MA37_9CAUD|nr:hypothetical protein PP653_gp097 [Bacillus phage Basilisk]AGR46614.1 hypothetical protein BASILISK_70 [Bacillus phage Basilisk]AXY83021.1 hypothetical protein vBBak1_061 [Bacillus phage v_B-Bak1]AXY83141.1 hypothetical protein vBBak6_061 [Bacillus phage v_B-Bak6]
MNNSITIKISSNSRDASEILSLIKSHLWGDISNSSFEIEEITREVEVDD